MTTSFTSEEIWAEIQERLTERARDKVAAVRVQAVTALARLQDPSNPGGCIVVSLLARMLATDPSAEVRRIVLGNIALCRSTLGAIIERIRDVKPEVRASALEEIGKRVDLKAMSISQRAELANTALKDRSPIVRHAATKLVIQSWLPSVGFNPLRLLNSLDAETNEEAGAEIVAHELLTWMLEGSSSEQKKFDWKNELKIKEGLQLSPEQALLLRVTIETLQKVRLTLLFITFLLYLSPSQCFLIVIDRPNILTFDPI